MESAAAFQKLVFPVISSVCLLVVMSLVKESMERHSSVLVLFMLLVCSKFRKENKFCRVRCVGLVYTWVPVTLVTRVIPLLRDVVLFAFAV